MWRASNGTGKEESGNRKEGEIPAPSPVDIQAIHGKRDDRVCDQKGAVMEKALRELADWPLHSECYDGSRAKNAAESLANVRRFAREALERYDALPHPLEDANGDDIRRFRP